MSSTTASPNTAASPTASWADHDRLGALIVVVTLSVCVVVVVIVAGVLALRARLSAIAFLGLVTTLLAALTPSPLTKLNKPGAVSVDNAEQVGPNV